MKNQSNQSAFPIVVVGHIDHGKSTVIGRLLYETNSLPRGKLEEIQKSCAKRKSAFEWSFVLDSLQIERDQAITVDTTQIWFNADGNRYVIIDAPGHEEFLRNMITGAARAEAGIIVVDVAEGICEQTRKHAYLLQLIGINDVIVAINKMDSVNYDQHSFDKIEIDIKTYLSKIGLNAVSTIPVSAIDGENLNTKTKKMNWYTGQMLTEALSGLVINKTTRTMQLRLPVQDVYRHIQKRVIVGKIESGSLSLTETVRVLPSNREAKITGFVEWPVKSKKNGVADESVAITLDKDLFVERGHIISTAASPPKLSNTISVRLFWLGSEALSTGDQIELRITTAVYDVIVESIITVIDTSDISEIQSDQIKQNMIADVVLRCRKKIVYDLFKDNSKLGRGVIADGYRILGGCIINSGKNLTITSKNLTKVPQSVSIQERANVNGYKGCVLWMCGLSGSGKSTLAMLLQRDLFARGINVYALDGDNIRSGLNRDLGFTEAERNENIRRVAEVAKLFSDSGTIIISAFIAPTIESREQAREIIGNNFYEIYINADIQTCEARDNKGLYAKAKEGKIRDFTGISAPWEPPTNPDLEINTMQETPKESLERIMEYLNQKILSQKVI